MCKHFRALMLLVLATGCSEGTIEPKEPNEPVLVTITPASLELTIGEPKSVSASVSGTNDQTVMFGTDDISIATVNSAGVVTPVAPGRTRIRATSNADPTVHAFAEVNVRPAGQQLTPGIPVRGISGQPGSERYYRLTVPAGATNLSVTTSGGSGDVELFVRYDAAPSIFEADCESMEYGNSESCVIRNPRPGDWYILLVGFSSYSNVTLSATVTGGTTGGSGSFALSLGPASASVTAGMSTNVTVTAQRSGGFSGSIALSALNLPSGVTASFSPASIGGGQTTATLTLAAAANTPATSATISVQGTATGMQSANASLSLTVTSAPISGSGNVAGISTGSNSEHTCVLLNDGAAYCWGMNNHGRLGDRTWRNSSVPVAVTGGHRFTKIQPGSAGTCALTSNGTAYCWGNSPFFGNNELEFSPDIPTAVKTNLRFTDLAVGSYHACGIALDGSAHCWGANTSGQLGTGTKSNTRSTTPVPVTGGLTFRSIAAGHGHTCGITTNHRAYCWGTNYWGLGDGVTGNGSNEGESLVPIGVAGGLSFARVTVGYDHLCGLTLEGAAYCWGFNGGVGTVGDGSTVANRLTPTAVAGGHTFTDIAAGQKTTCAISTTGQAWCWGANTGRIGDGTSTHRLTPVPVAGGFSWRSIDIGYLHSCGVTTTGAAYCWGEQATGRLGNGASLPAILTVPTPVRF